MRIFLAGSAVFLCLLGSASGMQLKIESQKDIYYEEDQILLKATILNDSSKTESYIIEFLQPRELNWMYIGGLHKLEIEEIPEMTNFTNHMPPEPKPHSPETSSEYKPIILKPGNTYEILIPFFYDYYPVELPKTFRLKLYWQGIYSNTVSITVHPTKGKPDKNNIIINGDFSQGEEGKPYGWKILDDKAVWDSSQNFLMYNVDRRTAENEGYWVYSIFHKINSPSDYILSVKTKTSGPIIIIFVEGWGIVQGRKRRIERNECFYHQPADQTWEKQVRNVHFKNSNVKWMRLKLYVYGSPGKVWFSDISMVPAEK